MDSAAQLSEHRPTPTPEGFPPTVAWGDYGGALRRAVVAHKDEGRLDIAAVLATLLAEVISASVEGLTAPVLVPVPSSAASRRRRGYDPLLDLGRSIRLVRPVPLVPALRVSARVRDQASLGQLERRANLAGSMSLLPGAHRLVEGADIVLFDDVVTTGSTLAEAARVLHCTEGPGGVAGVASVRAAVICATRRRN